MKSVFYSKLTANFFGLFKDNLNSSVISFFSLMLLTGILLFILYNILPLLNNNGLSLLDKSVSIILLFSFVYSGLHCVGYLDHLLKSLTLYSKKFLGEKFKLTGKAPSVAIIIPTLNEDPDMVKETILKAKNVDYDNFQVILMDSSTDDIIRGETAEMCNSLSINYMFRDTLRGFKAGSINDTIKNLNKDFKYVLILDSDHRLKRSVFQDLIPIMENDSSLTFIQTPQYFEMPDKDRLALAYSFQQHVFYKHICRGLCVYGTSYICGTNVLIKLDDLNKIGGMDEDCITEDIATSFIFHTYGYKSIYIDTVYAVGLPPPSLSAYYNQQMRWSYGTFQNTKKVLGKLFSEPNSLKSVQWWEYIVLIGTWYFIGLATLIWLMYPVAVLLFNLKPVFLSFLNVPLYVFLVMVLTQTLTSRGERGYPLKELLLSQSLFLSLFPVYIRAFIYGLFNRKLSFKVTPKKKVHKISFKEVFPHVFLIIILVVSIFIGLSRLIKGENMITYPSIIFWASYNVFMLSIFLIYFYREDNEKATRL